MRLIASFKRFFLRNRYIFLFFISFLIWIVLFRLLDTYYRVHTVDVVGLSGSDRIIGVVQLQNAHIWFIDEEQIQKNIQTANPSYDVKEIKKIYPNTLVINVRRLYPSAYLKIGDGYILLSKEGNIIQKDRIIIQKLVPLINYYQNISHSTYKSGNIIDKKDIRDALYFLEVVKSTKEKVLRIDIAGYHMLGLYTKDHEYIFSSEKERELQMYQYEQFLKQFQIQGTKFRGIDFRFDKPVVKF